MTAGAATTSLIGSATGTGAVLFLFFFVVFFFLPMQAAAPPPPPQHKKHNAKRSSHCQICMKEPDEPEAVDPEDAEEPPGNDESPLRLEPTLRDPKEDIDDA